MRSFAFLAAAALALPVAAQPTDEAAAVRSAAQALEAARLGGDRAALERLLAPDFLFVRASGRIGDQRDFIAGYTDPADRLASFVVSDRLYLSVAPNVAIVGGEAEARGGAATASARFRFTDSWVLRDGRWLVAFEQITPLP